ncbi:hypothetical protein [Candidatus Poriferisodalis sp.]|uniref:hypothetical protein n=1 Tax=Candidatus Poriferisodalis sp. TaxID=3101277 RepID=UPI003B017CBF
MTLTHLPHRQGEGTPVHAVTCAGPRLAERPSRQARSSPLRSVCIGEQYGRLHCSSNRATISTPYQRLHFATVPWDTPIWRATSAGVVLASIHSISIRRPAGVERALE